MKDNHHKEKKTPDDSYHHKTPGVHPLIRFNYFPRILGYGLFLIIFYTLFHATSSLYVWAAIIAHTIIWPHVAYMIGWKSSDPRRAEFRNMLVESFVVGIWMNLIEFSFWPCTAFFTGGALNVMAIGGLRLFIKGLACLFSGVLLAGLFNGFEFSPQSSVATSLASALTILVYSCIVSYVSFVNASKIREQKKSLKKAHDDIKEKLILTQLEIDERKRVEKELQVAKFKAEEANKEKSKFLATMSHEIRTPMNAIMGMTDLALQSKDAQSINHYLSIVKDSSNHLLVIINDILDFSKIESGKLTLEHTDFNLPQLLERVINTLSFDADQKNLFLKLSVEPDMIDYVKGDPSRLIQILINIISNALKFTHAGGVTITLKQLTVKDKEGMDNPHLLFSIKDTGIGIPEDQRDSIFERFSQIERNASHIYGGTGLGLAICKKIIEAMGGKIWVESEEEKGSTFFFTIPLIPGKKPEEGFHPGATGHIKTIRNLSILLAEDNPTNIELTKLVLKGMGHHVSIAHNGAEAVDMVKNGTFDLILMDIEMPEMNGLEASTHIRKGLAGPEKSNIPIIAMTAHAIDNMMQAYTSAGIDHSISKPINIHSLDDIIQKVVKDHQRAT